MHSAQYTHRGKRELIWNERMLCAYKNHQNCIAVSIEALLCIYSRKWLEYEQRTQNTEHSVHKVQWAVACHRYYENMLKRIVLKSHTKCKNEEFLQEKQRNGAPCSILSIYSFGEGIIWWCLWSWTLWSFLSYCSFYLIYFTSKFSIQIEKELNWRLLSHLTDVTHFECVLQCIQNIFLKIYAKIRIVVIGVVFFSICLTFLLLFSTFFSPFFSISNNTLQTSDPIQIHFVLFCESFKCILGMNKMLLW